MRVLLWNWLIRRLIVQPCFASNVPQLLLLIFLIDLLNLILFVFLLCSSFYIDNVTKVCERKPIYNFLSFFLHSLFPFLTVCCNKNCNWVNRKGLWIKAISSHKISIKGKKKRKYQIFHLLLSRKSLKSKLLRNFFQFRNLKCWYILSLLDYRFKTQ